MTAKKKTLIELMLDAGVTPFSINSDTKYFVSDEPYESGKSAISQYKEKPSFNKAENDWHHSGYIAPVCVTEYHPVNWKRTIITKQQFIDAYNEKHGLSEKTNIAEDNCTDDIEPLKVVVENNTNVALTPAHYSIIDGKDLIARSADSYKTDEFRGAMRFNIEKYIDRLGKKDSLAKELRKIADYANRWADYEEKLQGIK